MSKEKLSPLAEDLRSVINRHSRENASNTPDFILAQVMEQALITFEQALLLRTNWYAPPPAEVPLYGPGRIDEKET